MEDLRLSSSLSWLSSTCVRFVLKLLGVHGVLRNQEMDFSQRLIGKYQQINMYWTSLFTRGNDVGVHEGSSTGAELPLRIVFSMASSCCLSYKRMWKKKSLLKTLLILWLLSYQHYECKLSSYLQTWKCTFCCRFLIMVSFWAVWSWETWRRLLCSSKALASLSTSSVAYNKSSCNTSS